MERVGRGLAPAMRDSRWFLHWISANTNPVLCSLPLPVNLTVEGPRGWNGIDRVRDALTGGPAALPESVVSMWGWTKNTRMERVSV